jgi:hypothetical protein
VYSADARGGSAAVTFGAVLEGTVVGSVRFPLRHDEGLFGLIETFGVEWMVRWESLNGGGEWHRGKHIWGYLYEVGL